MRTKLGWLILLGAAIFLSGCAERRYGRYYDGYGYYGGYGRYDRDHYDRDHHDRHDRYRHDRYDDRH